ncbi:MAG TPA: GNAT family N-acetyltransferase [Gemmatimonadales bacterium]
MPGHGPAALSQETADGNLVTHMTWVQSRLPGGHVELGEDLVLSDSGLPCDSFNFVCRARMNLGAAAAVARVVKYFISAGRPFSWWVGPADRPADLGRALLDAGFAAAESELAMTADLDRLGSADLAPGGLRIERATTPQRIRDFAVVNAANWSPPDAQVLRFYELAAPILASPEAPLRLYVGYLGGEGVATSELTVSEGAVGLYNISTVEAHRRKGIGSALTLRPLVDARAEGHRLAVLQASEDGQGVYARIGFRATGRYTEYQLPRA